MEELVFVRLQSLSILVFVLSFSPALAQTDTLNKAHETLEFRYAFHDKIYSDLEKKFAEVRTLNDEFNSLKALETAKSALEVSSAQFGENDAWTVEALSLVGQTYDSLGDFAEAESYFTRALNASSAVFGSSDENTLLQKYYLGTVLISQSRYIEALRTFEDILEKIEPTYEEGNRFLMNVRSAIADCQYSMDDYEQALVTYYLILADSERALGRNHPDTLTTVYSIATVESLLGNADVALSMMNRFVSWANEEYGSNHINTAYAFSGLGTIHLNSGDVSKAIEWLEAATATSEAVLGKQHPTTLAFAISLANGNLEAARMEEAERGYLEVLEGLKGSVGEFHADTVSVMSSLAILYAFEGKIAKAQEFARKAELAETEMEMSGNYTAGASEDALAAVYYELGLFDEAARIYERQIDLDDLPGKYDGGQKIAPMTNLARVYTLQNRYAEAERLLLQSLQIAEETLGENHQQTISILNSLAMFYREQERNYEAKGVLQRILNQPLRTLSELHPNRLSATSFLAEVLEAEDAFFEAETLHLAAVLGSDLAFPKESVEPAYHIGSYALYLKNRGDLSAAIFFQKRVINIIQNSRSRIKKLGAQSRQAFLQRNAYQYERLQSWLIESGRFAEAEQIGRMKKEAEFHEFVRQRKSGDEDPRAMRAELTTLERNWKNQLDEWSQRPNQVALQLNALKKKRRSAEALSDLELEQLGDLQRLHQDLYGSYKVKINNWREDLRSISDDRIKREALELSSKYHDSFQEEIARLGSDVALLQIVALEESLHFFLITPQAFFHRELEISRSNAFDAIFAARQALRPHPKSGRLSANIKVELKVLYELFFAPVASELRDAGTKTLMLNLQGSLRYVPFSALFDGENYLIESYDIAWFTPAARTRFYSSTIPATAVGFGVAKQFKPFEALPGVSNELNAILGTTSSAGLLSGNKYLDEAFTKQRLVTELADAPPIVHLASHFYMRPGNDANSFLLMGDGSYLTMAEINQSVGLTFKGVELLTLSACSTALSTEGDYAADPGTGIEVEGFGVLAQSKGADAVVASLWNVADEATSQLMIEMYSRLIVGDVSKARALSTAQRKLLGDPNTEHPYFWAPFILMGNWK